MMIMAQENVFAIRKRRFLRKRIPRMENIAAFILICGLAGIVLWVMAQKNNYHPEDRDISPEHLIQRSNQEKLYSLPFKPWVEPGTETQSLVQNLGIFPETIVDQEWMVESRLKQFTPDNLFEKINGEAEKFLQQGFQSLHYLVLTSKEDGSELAIELYDQGDMGGSMGIFSDHMSDDNVIEQHGQVIFFQTPVGAIGRKGKYFFRIAGDRENDNVRQKSVQLAQAFTLLQEIEEETSVGFRILNRGLDIPSERITFQSENVFQFDFAKDFWFGQLELENPARVFVHQTSSPAEVGQLFEEILEEQSYEYEIVDETESTVILFHNFLQTYFVISYQGAFIFGIEHLAQEKQIAPIMERLTGELEG
jgi:hypothetical protein